MTAVTTGPEAPSLEDPAADIRDAIALASGVPELPNKIWFQKTAAGVIDADRCVGCGSCIAACPSRSIGVGEDGRPTLVRMCTGCSACWDYCPMGGLRTERLARDVMAERDVLRADALADGGLVDTEPHEELGFVLAAHSARAVNRPGGAQDGGVVTALLSELMRVGFIDGAILNQRVDAIRGKPVLATSPEEVQACAGSVYHQSHLLAALNEPLPDGVRRIALVGTPCQISGLRAIQRFPWTYRETSANEVVLAIALFCTRSFDPELLGPAIEAHGVDLDRVSQVDVRDGQMIAREAGGAELMRVPVKEMRAASLMGCTECTDYSGLSADLSVGSMGSDPGWTTVMARSATGREALERGASAISVADGPDLERIDRAAVADMRRAGKALARGYDPDAPLWVPYTSHLEAYSGTDREAAAPPSFRSQHYDVSC